MNFSLTTEKLTLKILSGKIYNKNICATVKSIERIKFIISLVPTSTYSVFNIFEGLIIFNATVRELLHNKIKL